MSDPTHQPLARPRPKGHRPGCPCVVCGRQPETMTAEQLRALFAGAPPVGVDAALAPALQPAAVTNKGGGKIK